MKLAKQQEARKLRAKGYSIKQIARSLGVSPGSVSVWVRAIRVSEEHLNGLMQRVRQNGTDVGRARAAAY
jgi:transposase-like protein